MPTRIWPLLAAALAAAALVSAGGAPPKLVLHIPFDGSADAAYCAGGALQSSAVHVVYHKGKKGQAAEIGSERFPCGVVLRSSDLFSKQAGSFAVWYKPLWDPADPSHDRVTRTLMTDEKPALGAGHFWITVVRKAVHFAWRGRRAEGVSAPIRGWAKGTWHHIVATWDSTEGIALYLDGELGGERKMRWRLPPSHTLYVGANRRGLNRAEGLLDELYLYDRALTPAEIELACVQNLAAPRAPVRKPPSVGPRPAQPRLTLHLPFDGSATAATARGDAKPATAKGLQFTNGLLGKALVCGQGIDLAYQADKNISKEAGAITFWARSSFDARTPRGILVADEQPPAPESEKPQNTLVVWLKRADLFRVEDKVLARPVLPTLYGDMLPASVSRGLFRWNNAEWYHVGLCWRRGHELALYVNGRPVARRAGVGATWPPAPAKLLRVGSWQGKMVAEAVVDDLRIYDAPLAPEQVRQEAARHLLPLVFQLRRTLLVRGKATDLVLDAYNTSTNAFDANVTVHVANPGGREAIAVTEPLKVEAGARAEIRLALSDKALAHKGLYRVTTASPKRVNTPLAYFLVVDEAPAPEAVAEPKPKLKLIESIDCAELTDASRLRHSGRSKVADAAGAKCRQAGPVRNDRFAVSFTVEAPGEPHLALVAYPDDGPRSAEIVISSKSFPNSLDAATGYFTSDSATGKMVELPIYFWPRERQHAVIVRTLESGRPAACATIAIYQVTDGLPAARVEPPADGGRPIGTWWREPAVPLHFGARGLLAPDIFESFRRLTDAVRLSGLNLLCYPLAWDMGKMYPSPSEGFRNGAGAERHCTDWVQYALHHCERGGMRFLPELFLGDTFALTDAFGSHSEEDLRAGVRTAKMVLWDGGLSRGGAHEPPLYTPAHPAAREAVLGCIDEIAARYASSPALEGVALHAGERHLVWFASLRCGYGDATIAQFEKDTGTRVPVDAKSRARFSQRARWLCQKRRQEWVAWRCRTVHALHAEAAARLARHRADLKLYLNIAVPDSAAWNPLVNLSTVASGLRTLDELHREGGIDLRLYTKSPNLVVRRVLSPTDYRSALYRGGALGAHPAAVRDHQLLSESNAPFRPLGRLAAVCAYRPFVSSIGRVQPLKELWWPEPAFRASYPTPSGRAFIEPLALALAELDVECLALGHTVLVTAGHEDAMRAFARAYRALPRTRFADVAGMADPVCARELRDGDAHYLYLVSRVGFPTDAYLAFQPAAVMVHDFASGEKVSLRSVAGRRVPPAMPKGFVSEHALAAEPGPLPGKATPEAVTGALLHVRLAPFELRSYRVLTRGAKLIHASSEASMAQRVRLAQRVESAKSLVEQSKAAPDVVAAARRTLALLDRAWAKRELARVEHLLDSYPIERLR